jgi:hypothetical protein
MLGKRAGLSPKVTSKLVDKRAGLRLGILHLAAYRDRVQEFGNHRPLRQQPRNDRGEVLPYGDWFIRFHARSLSSTFSASSPEPFHNPEILSPQRPGGHRPDRASSTTRMVRS